MKDKLISYLSEGNLEKFLEIGISPDKLLNERFLHLNRIFNYSKTMIHLLKRKVFS